MTAGAILLFAAGCERNEADATASARMQSDDAGTGTINTEHPHGSSGTEPEAGKQLYQCSMHPNVISDKPGVCPICGMDLQPVTQISAKGISGRAPVELTGLQEQLINIRTSPVTKAPFDQTLRAVGRVVVNEENTATLNSRVMGWVEQLYVDKTGERVGKGQSLLEIYSPALYSAQQDFMIVYNRAQESGASDGLLESARKRLELWGISDEQVRELEQTGTPSLTLTLTAPLAGTVIDKQVVAAQMVEPGMPLYRIADLSEVWVLAELYESELPLVEIGQKATVTTRAYPGRQWEGRVDFIYPFLQGKTRTNQVRVVLPNADGLLKPDMYVDVELARDLGPSLSVPASSIFDTGKRQYVFVEQSDGIFVPTLVQLGPRVGDRQLIRSGVEPGDEVVVDGNFLLDSESQLKAVASGMGDEAPAAADDPDEVPGPIALPDAAQELYSPLLESYLSIHHALANDELEGLSTEAAKLREQVNIIADSDVRPSDQTDIYQQRVEELHNSVQNFSAGSLDEARIAFGNVSFDLIALLTQFPPPFGTALHVVNCPMWEKSPARWIQTQEQIVNPFMGQQMPSCGELVSTIEGSN